MDDDVILEMPVYLSKSLNEHLYMLQYPVRPSARADSNLTITGAKFKPNQQKLHVTTRLNTRSRSYDSKKAADLAADKIDEQGNKLFSSGKMDQQTHVSEKSVSASSRYVVGVVSHGELHLSPLSGILNMSPSFMHMDTNAKDLGEPEEEDADEPHAVNVKFARQETERMKLARERSYKYLQAKNAEEKWIPLTFHPKDSVKSELEREQLVCGTVDDDDAVNVHCPGEEYLKNLIPSVDKLEEGDSHNKSKSLTQLKHLPLTDQVHAIFTNARVLRFDQLVGLMKYSGSRVSIDPRELLLAVQQHAHLVRGVWVVKSDTLYSHQGTSFIPPALLSRGRDYILYMFTQKEFVERRSVTTATKLPAEEIEEILKEVAVYVKQKGWGFKVERDAHFERTYPDIVRRQEMLWEGRQQQLNKDFKEQGRPVAKSPRTRKTSRSARDSFSSDGESGGESSGRKRRGSGRGSTDITIPPFKL